MIARPRIITTLGLVLAFTLGWLLVATVVVVRTEVLDADTYTSALVTTNAYERTYTEVFADPEFGDLQLALLGRIGLDGFLAVQARALKTNALRWTVPPSALRTGTEAVIGNVLAYVRGDTDRVDADVAIDSVLERIDDTAVMETRAALASSADVAVSSIAALACRTCRLRRSARSGQHPDVDSRVGWRVVRVAGCRRLDHGTARAIGERHDSPPGHRSRDVGRRARDALITAASLLVARHADEVEQQLQSAADGVREFDVVGEIADHARQPAAQVVGSLDSVRDAAFWFRPLTAIIGFLLAAAAAAGLLWSYRRSPRSGFVALAIALLVAGVSQLLLWGLVAHVVPAPLDDATATGPGSWRLPTALRVLLGDVQRAVAADISSTVRLIAGSLVVAAVVVGVIAIFGSRIRAIRPGAAVAGGVVVVLVVGGGIALAASNEDDSVKACNGHAELCGRHYDDVVYGATHNSMSSPDVVTIWPEHDGNIRSQLDAGVRALLIDSHYWTPVESPAGLSAPQAVSDAVQGSIPPALADLIYPTLGDLRNGRDGTFLCHINCVFGAIAFTDAMTEVRDFLDDNPDEVVTLIIQDAISTDDTAAVMKAAGVESFLYHHDGHQGSDDPLADARRLDRQRPAAGRVRRGRRTTAGLVRQRVRLDEGDTVPVHFARAVLLRAQSWRREGITVLDEPLGAAHRTGPHRLDRGELARLPRRSSPPVPT